GIREWAIFMLNPQGEILSWNAGAERIHGYKAEKVIGSHFRMLCSQADQEAQKPELALRIAARSGRFADSCWFIKSDGSKYWANVTIGRVLDDAQNLLGFYTLARDLTRREE